MWPQPGDDPTAFNRHQRRIWTKIQLDGDMVPSAVWRDSRSRYDPELQLRQEEELRDPEAAGLVILPLERRAV